MGHIQQYTLVDKEKDHKSSVKFVGLISLMPVLIFLLLIWVFPLNDVTIMEQESLKAKPISIHSDSQKNRKRMPLQPLEGLSAREKYLFLNYVVFGKSLRELRNVGKKGETNHRSRY
jgi:hypothetical protein